MNDIFLQEQLADNYASRVDHPGVGLYRKSYYYRTHDETHTYELYIQLGWDYKWSGLVKCWHDEESCFIFHSTRQPYDTFSEVYYDLMQSWGTWDD